MTPLVSVLIKRNVRVKGKFDCKNYQAGKDLLRKLQCSRFYPAPFITLRFKFRKVRNQNDL